MTDANYQSGIRKGKRIAYTIAGFLIGGIGVLLITMLLTGTIGILEGGLPISNRDGTLFLAAAQQITYDDEPDRLNTKINLDDFFKWYNQYAGNKGSVKIRFGAYDKKITAILSVVKTDGTESGFKLITVSKYREGEFLKQTNSMDLIKKAFADYKTYVRIWGSPFDPADYSFKMSRIYEFDLIYAYCEENLKEFAGIEKLDTTDHSTIKKYYLVLTHAYAPVEFSKRHCREVPTDCYDGPVIDNTMYMGHTILLHLSRVGGRDFLGRRSAAFVPTKRTVLEVPLAGNYFEVGKPCPPRCPAGDPIP